MAAIDFDALLTTIGAARVDSQNWAGGPESDATVDAAEHAEEAVAHARAAAAAIRADRSEIDLRSALVAARAAAAVERRGDDDAPTWAPVVRALEAALDEYEA